MTKTDPFFQAYIEAALWSSTDDKGDPFDDCYSLDDIAPTSLAEALEDCQAFQESNREDLAEINPAQAGHDFWLTRNRHGAGFWDRGLGAVGKRLTDCAHAYGSCDLYVGDDGQVYFS